MTTFDYKIQGIPCVIEVTHFHHQKRDLGADNPYDFYGYTDVEFRVLDRRGNHAQWLENKLDKDDVLEIEQKIIDDMNYSDDFVEPYDFDY